MHINIDNLHNIYIYIYTLHVYTPHVYNIIIKRNSMEQFLTPTGVVWCDQYRCLPSELQLRAVKRWGEQDWPPTVPFSCIFLLSVKAVEARIHTFCRWPGALFRAPIGSISATPWQFPCTLDYMGQGLLCLVCVWVLPGGTCLWGCRGLGTKIILCLPGSVGWLAKRLWACTSV